MLKTNYEMYREVIKDLSMSNGSYARLNNDLNSLGEKQIEDIREYLNGLPPFKDRVDVIIWMEG